VNRALVSLAVLIVSLAAAAAPATQPDPPSTVAVQLFAHASVDAKHRGLAQVAGEMLMTLLAEQHGFVVVERNALQAVLKEQRLSLADLTQRGSQIKVGRLLGAKFMLFGTLTVVRDRLRIDAHLVEVETGRLVKAAAVEGRPDSLAEPVAELAGKLLKSLDLKPPELTGSAIDTKPNENLLFMRALSYHYARMPDHAVIGFMRLLRLNPKHARARYWCGVTYFGNREYAHARIELRRFLKQFPRHELAPKAKDLLIQCETHLKKAQTTQPSP